MAKTILFVLLVAVVAVVLRGRLKIGEELPMDFQSLPGPERVARAKAASETRLVEKFRAAEMPYPPAEVFLRWFKREAVLELWARNNDHGPFVHVTDYPILASSGKPGPKRKEGDKQVPEGFYVINRFNPESLYHLSLGLDYPNGADLVHADREQPGSDIFIHGSNGSSGCAPLGDPAIEEVYLAALGAKNRGQTTFAVHIFPARMSGPDWADWAEAATTETPALAPFWAEIQPGYEIFENTHRLPVVTVTPDGHYEIAPPER